MFRTIVLASLAATFATAAAADTSNSAQAARDAANLSVLQAYYPKRALAAREQGMVGFVVKIDATGQPTECRVVMSSGYPLLDKETCDLITLRATFKRPEGVSPSQVATHQGVVTWKLPDTMKIDARNTSKAVASMVQVEKKVCRRVARTGSLVANERVCMTATEWKRQSDENKESWEGLQGRKGSTTGN